MMLAAAFAAGGCGGGSGKAAAVSPPPSGGPLSQAQLVAKADAICARVDTEISDVKPVAPGPAEIAVVAPRSAALQRSAVAELSRLTPPPAVAPAWQRLIAYRRTLAEGLAKLASYAKQGDPRGVQAAGAALRLPRTLLASVRRAGLQRCLVSG
jgi:hypothetical protein